jgi:hypothetical protein
MAWLFWSTRTLMDLQERMVRIETKMDSAYALANK